MGKRILINTLAALSAIPAVAFMLLFATIALSVMMPFWGASFLIGLAWQGSTAGFSWGRHPEDLLRKLFEKYRVLLTRAIEKGKAP